MNFYPNEFNPFMINPNYINDMMYKINELENRVKKLEQSIETYANSKNNHNEPDNNLYMI